MLAIGLEMEMRKYLPLPRNTTKLLGKYLLIKFIKKTRKLY
jgi:hypothetical protein